MDKVPTFVASLQKLSNLEQLSTFLQWVINSENYPRWCPNSFIAIEYWLEKILEHRNVKCGLFLTKVLLRYVVFVDESELHKLTEVYFHLTDLVATTSKCDIEDSEFCILFWEAVNDLLMNLYLRDPKCLHDRILHLQMFLFQSCIDLDCNIHLRKMHLKSLNFFLKHGTEDFKVLFLAANANCISYLLSSLSEIGEYDAQTYLIEAVFRLSSSSERIDNVKNWLIGFPYNIQCLFIRIQDFGPDCRRFLNAFNAELKDKRRVFSFAFSEVRLGDYIFKKPERLSFKHSWIDFNLGSLSLSLLYDRCNENTASVEPECEMIIVYDSEVDKAVLSRDIYGQTLNLTLAFEPIYYFSSSPPQDRLQLMSRDLLVEFIGSPKNLKKVCIALFGDKLQIHYRKTSGTSKYHLKTSMDDDIDHLDLDERMLPDGCKTWNEKISYKKKYKKVSGIDACVSWTPEGTTHKSTLRNESDDYERSDGVHSRPGKRDMLLQKNWVSFTPPHVDETDTPSSKRSIVGVHSSMSPYKLQNNCDSDSEMVTLLTATEKEENHSTGDDEENLTLDSLFVERGSETINEELIPTHVYKTQETEITIVDIDEDVIPCSITSNPMKTPFISGRHRSFDASKKTRPKSKLQKLINDKEGACDRKCGVKNVEKKIPDIVTIVEETQDYERDEKRETENIGCKFFNSQDVNREPQDEIDDLSDDFSKDHGCRSETIEALSKDLIEEIVLTVHSNGGKDFENMSDAEEEKLPEIDVKADKMCIENKNAMDEEYITTLKKEIFTVSHGNYADINHSPKLAEKHTFEMLAVSPHCLCAENSYEHINDSSLNSSENSASLLPKENELSFKESCVVQVPDPLHYVYEIFDEKYCKSNNNSLYEPSPKEELHLLSAAEILADYQVEPCGLKTPKKPYDRTAGTSANKMHGNNKKKHPKGELPPHYGRNITPLEKRSAERSGSKKKLFDSNCFSRLEGTPPVSDLEQTEKSLPNAPVSTYGVMSPITPIVYTELLNADIVDDDEIFLRPALLRGFGNDFPMNGGPKETSQSFNRSHERKSQSSTNKDDTFKGDMTELGEQEINSASLEETCKSLDGITMKKRVSKSTNKAVKYHSVDETPVLKSRKESSKIVKRKLEYIPNNKTVHLKKARGKNNTSRIDKLQSDRESDSPLQGKRNSIYDSMGCIKNKISVKNFTFCISDEEKELEGPDDWLREKDIGNRKEARTYRGKKSRPTYGGLESSDDDWMVSRRKRKPKTAVWKLPKRPYSIRDSDSENADESFLFRNLKEPNGRKATPIRRTKIFFTRSAAKQQREEIVNKKKECLEKNGKRMHVDNLEYSPEVLRNTSLNYSFEEIHDIELEHPLVPEPQNDSKKRVRTTETVRKYEFSKMKDLLKNILPLDSVKGSAKQSNKCKVPDPPNNTPFFTVTKRPPEEAPPTTSKDLEDPVRFSYIPEASDSFEGMCKPVNECVKVSPHINKGICSILNFDPASDDDAMMESQIPYCPHSDFSSNDETDEDLTTVSHPQKYVNSSEPKVNSMATNEIIMDSSAKTAEDLGPFLERDCPPVNGEEEPLLPSVNQLRRDFGTVSVTRDLYKTLASEVCALKSWAGGLTPTKFSMDNLKTPSKPISRKLFSSRVPSGSAHPLHDCCGATGSGEDIPSSTSSHSESVILPISVLIELLDGFKNMEEQAIVISHRAFMCSEMLRRVLSETEDRDKK